MQYVTYARVSTKGQGQSGLGLEAQRAAVQRFLKPGDVILSEYVEVESGKRDNRPELLKAITQVQATGAILLIAKLDRLSRNASFIFRLRDTGVPFIAADMPDANHLTVGIMSVLADHERQMISERTRSALAALKARGVKLGAPVPILPVNTRKGLETICKNAQENPSNRRAGLLSVSLYRQGAAYAEIARQLNAYGFQTRYGKHFTAMQVKRLVQRYGKS